MSREFRLILRFMGTDIDGTKKVAYGLGKIRGVGPNLAFAVVKAAKINPEARMGALSDGELSRVEVVIKDPLKHVILPRMVNRRKDIETVRDMHLVGADLALKIKSDIDLMKDIQSWKGVRHSFFFKAEDGIRDAEVTGVQTCALPISCPRYSTLSPAKTLLLRYFMFAAPSPSCMTRSSAGGRSLPVTTALTPGSARARLTSIERMGDRKSVV